MKILAADIGGTAFKIAEITDSGTVLSFEEHPSGAKEGGPAMMGRLCALLEQHTGFDRIGISTAGQVDPENGSILYANENIPRYTGMPVKQLLEERFSVPAAVENDVNAAALGEGAYGAAKGFSDFLCLTFGTGIGGAAVVNGRLMRGVSGAAGEFGHLVTHKGGLPCACGGSGCYEQYASASALVREGAKCRPECRNGREFFRLMEEGDAALSGVLDSWAEEAACGLASLIHVFNPPCVVLGGGILQNGELFSRLEAALKKAVMPSFLARLSLRRAELGNKAGVFGASLLR